MGKSHSIYMTSKEYAQEGGLRCPACKCPDVEISESRPYTEDETKPLIYRHVQCNSCGFRFMEIYHLQGYEVE